ncbi:MAG: manganese efflux pump MntP family protein, partial [Firmicutes bacterium]|nr:manganese efflux pump MntP family protein [Bacillota bacterium]
VSICKGLSVGKLQKKHLIITGLYFGGFQALMPLLGYLLGIRFQSLITSVDHWIAFVLLALIGANMIREARGAADELDADFSFKAMLPLSIATSIDALAVGITFAFLDVSIAPAVAFIGAVTFILSAAGVKIGNVFGAKYRSVAELVGGIVLILMGIKILLEHLGILG